MPAGLASRRTTPRWRGNLVVLVAVAGGLLLAGCGGGADDPSESQRRSDSDSTTSDPKPAPTDEAVDGEQRYPDVVEVEVTETGDTFSFSVTMSSPYDTPERYADGWRIMDADGTVYAEHTLMHDHANEQPFTREQNGVEIPADVTEVIVEGRDKANGFGGETKTVTIPR